MEKKIECRRKLVIKSQNIERVNIYKGKSLFSRKKIKSFNILLKILETSTSL